MYVPCLGCCFQRRFFTRVKLIYDILINYIDCHEHVLHHMLDELQHLDFVQVVEEEVKSNIQKAKRVL